MPLRHGLQSSRFEFNHIIDEQCAADVRDIVQSCHTQSSGESESICSP